MVTVTREEHDPGLAARLATGLTSRSVQIQSLTALITVLLVMSPIVPIVYQSLIDRPIYDAGHQITLTNYANLWRNPELRQVLANTFILATASTIVAQILGAVFAVLLGRTDLPGRRWLGDVMLWPLFVSSLVLGFGWFMMYGPAGYMTMMVRAATGGEPWNLYSMGGIALVAGVSHMPLTLLYCLGSTALANPILEDAARSCGASPLRTIMTITLPLLRPALLYSAVLNFTLGLEMLSIPLIFGEPARINVLTTLLYTQGISTPRPDYGLVGTGAVVLLVIVTILVFLQNRMLSHTQRYITVGGKASRPKLFRLGPLRWAAFALVAGYALFFIILPLGILGLRASVSFLSPLVPFWTLFSTEFFREVLEFAPYRRAILNTLLVATIGAAGATFFIAMIALVVHRSDFPFRRQLEYFAIFPRAVPGLIVGIGFFYAIVVLPPLGWLRNSIWILIVAYTMRYIPTGFGAISPSLFQIAPDLDRSARVSGADWWRVSYSIVLPLMKPALFTCFALLFMQFLKEYSTAIFLFAPGSEVIGPMLIQLWVQGKMGAVAALATIQIAITAAFLYAIRRLLGIKIYG